MTSRREAIQKLFKGSAFAITGALGWGGFLSNTNSNSFVLRPPGALAENEFIQACIKCGQCVTACPYKTLELSTNSDEGFIGTPYFKPRTIPCYMCTDYPCIKTCPTDALSTKRIKKSESETPSINNAQMGLAVVHTESCIAFHGIQCDACYRACPLIGEAITLVVDRNTDTNRHANMKPLINSEVCTGCGLCEHACVTEKAAIFILPREMATGKIGDHYHLLNSKKGDTPQKNELEPLKDRDTQSALDYLNNDDILAD